MSTANKNLSSFTSSIPHLHDVVVGIVIAEWNNEITFALRDGAVNTLLQAGIKKENINIQYVPGSYELTLGALNILEDPQTDAVICLGCVIQGETPHFTFICDAVAHGIMQLNITYKKPVIFGVLTTLDQQQAIDRSGGKHGNKGDEAAFTALKMIELQKSN